LLGDALVMLLSDFLWHAFHTEYLHLKALAVGQSVVD
jgi:hypothetical protein